jgi:hypothetical protein
MDKVADFMTGEFSLILGGPLFQLLRRAHLTGDTLERISLEFSISSGPYGNQVHRRAAKTAKVNLFCAFR